MGKKVLLLPPPPQTSLIHLPRPLNLRPPLDFIVVRLIPRRLLPLRLHLLLGPRHSFADEIIDGFSHLTHVAFDVCRSEFVQGGCDARFVGNRGRG